MDARRRDFAAVCGPVAILALQMLFLGAPIGARAQQEPPRFGDSTWVAPGGPFEAKVTADGPRVAPPDRERGWETALRTPFRVVFLPVRLVAIGFEKGIGHFGPRFLDPKPRRAPPSGPRLGVAVALGTGTDLRVGPAVTWIGFPTADSKLRATATWSFYDRRNLRFYNSIETHKPVSFRLRADYDRKPNRRYYGIGNTTPQADQSHFLLETTDADASVVLGVSPLRQLRVLGGYSSMSPRRGYNGTPLMEEVFSLDDVPYARRTTRGLVFGVSGDLAAIDDGRDPSRGLHARAKAKRFVGMRSRDPDYDEWWLEGRAYLPVFAKRRVLAFRGVLQGVEPRGDTTTVLPFYRLAQSEGDARFAGFPSGRFRDRQLMLLRGEYRWMIIHRISAVALYELGQVAPRLGAFSMREFHKTYGGGLRLGLNDESAARLEVITSVEGLRVGLSLGSTF